MINRKEKIALLKSIAAGKATIQDLNDETKIVLWRPAADLGFMETFNCNNVRRLSKEQFAKENAASNAMQITLNI